MTIFLSFLFLVFIIILIILGLIYIINMPTHDYEKHSAYECGFEPFGDARSFFDIHFYTVGLLFIIFDLEIVFLIPFSSDIEATQPFEYFNFIIFMAILVIGFYYEWALGLLNWIPTKTFKKKQKPELTYFTSSLLRNRWNGVLIPFSHWSSHSEYYRYLRNGQGVYSSGSKRGWEQWDMRDKTIEQYWRKKR